MVYFGIFLVLIALGLWWASARLDSWRSTTSATESPTTRFIPTVSPGAAAIMVAAVGVFLVATNLTGMH
jgi:hypothetical protein